MYIMSQYKGKINNIISELEYLEELEKLEYVLAADNKYTIAYKHGGKHSTFLRDTKTHKKGDIVIEPPDDELYIKLNKKYRNDTPLLKIFTQWIKKCLMSK